MDNPNDTLTDDEVNMLMTGKTIQCIKHVRQRLNLPLADAKQFVDDYALKHGVKLRWLVSGQRTN